MIQMIKRAVSGLTSGVAIFFTVIGILALAAVLSFLAFTLGYWIITLILASFFSVVLPFSWWYSLGAWLITMIASLFILPGYTVSRD